ncbi:MAG: transporter [Chloroflexi bacterium]|nr:transporter [Chloroflexota bacterium]
MNARIYLLALGTFALGTDLFVIAGVLPAIAHDTGVDVNVAGLLVTVFALVYGFAAPTLAALTETVSRRTLLLVVLLGFCIANVCSAIAPTFPVLMATRIVAACFAALFTPTATATAAALAAPERRGQALGIVLGGGNIATILGVPIGTSLGLRLGWRATFLFVALLAGLAFISLLTIRLKDVPAAPILGIRARIAPLFRPSLLLALLPIAFSTFGVWTTYTYVAPFLAQHTHISDPSLMLFVYGAGGVVGSWLGGYLVDRLGPARPIVFGLIVLIAVYITLPFTASTILGAVFALALWGIFGTVLFAPQQHRMLSLTPTLPTVILALNSSVIYLGAAGGSAIGSLVLAHGSLSTLPPISAVLTTVSLVFFALSILNSLQQTRKNASSLTQAPVHGAK